ncbi:hypothetical protein Trydic_g8053 [Trypoxylus dichotomus]
MSRNNATLQCGPESDASQHQCKERINAKAIEAIADMFLGLLGPHQCGVAKAQDCKQSRNEIISYTRARRPITNLCFQSERCRG